jgi:dGTPase
MTIRERIERQERETLSPYAAFSADTRGRERSETECDVRTAYQRDRDRIIHQCKGFRRLAHKTQVFISPRQDHIRTRLSHTLEVSQIARTIAKALGLNEALTEAIALGHDVGHTPFGHGGEAILDATYRKHDPEAAFHHAAHSLRLLTVIENDGAGLNLCQETLDGIASHSKGRQDLADLFHPEPTETLEAMVVRLSDRIAYVNHDIDDCLRAGLIRLEEIPAECTTVLGDRHSARIGTMVRDVIEQSQDCPHIRMSDCICRATDVLKDFLYDRVYHSPPMLRERERVRVVLESLFDLYMESDDELASTAGGIPADPRGRARLVCDYLAGMTDRYATDRYLTHFLPGAHRAGE